MVINPATQTLGPAVAAIELLIRKGYTATSVEELADVAGMGRSTFFRKFGSKEDVVFADHERILTWVDEYLSRATADPLTAIADVSLMVFDEHIRNRETSLLRNRLLQQVQALRERELVTTHRYERSFRDHLQAALPASGGQIYLAVAFAAAVVAVHNRILRQWLREAAGSADELLDKEMTTLLGRELRALVDLFRPALSADPEPDRPAVVVTVLDRGAGTERILEAVREALA